MMNLLQPSGYCTCRQGQKLACVLLAHFIYVFHMLLSINSKYPPVQYSPTVFLMEEHCILCEEHVSIIVHRNQQLQCTVSLHPPHPLMATLFSSATKDAFCMKCLFVRGGADKSLARPGRKQSTATNLGIYSTHSPRRSIHFLDRSSNFCKPLKKKIKTLSIQPGLRGSNDLRVGRKMATFQLFFRSKKQVVVRRGQFRRIGRVIKILEAQVGQFLLNCRCPVSQGIVVQEQDPLGDLPAVFFLQHVLQLH